MATIVTGFEENKFCDCLVHPFQNDPGVSQQQRVMSELLSGQAKIDARTTADLLYYFYELSRQINYYDEDLGISDWQPFFEKSIPFVLAGLIRYDAKNIKGQFDFLKLSFEKKPSAEGLQLAQLFVFYNTVRRMGNWYSQLNGSDLPVERVMGNIVRDKIKPALLKFISLNRISNNLYKIRPINFSGLFKSDSGEIVSEQDVAKQLKADRTYLENKAACGGLKELYEQTVNLFSSFYEPVKLLNKAAELSLEQSFLPLKDELQKKHLPHLALMFAFIKLFQKLQGDLNGYTKKHLDFFYKDVLKLKPKKAVADKAHIVFAIQKELNNYLLKKGLLLIDGKDVNKEEILFATDDEIVVNQAQVVDTRTLFLNNLLVPPSDPKAGKEKQTLTEGVYMAPDATKADGVDKDFQSEVKNFYTVGNKDSKYITPGTNLFKPYPPARLGFILGSPVLYLQEGKRTITITLKCKYEEGLCNSIKENEYPEPKKCCADPVGIVKPQIFYRTPLSSFHLLQSVVLTPIEKIIPIPVNREILDEPLSLAVHENSNELFNQKTAAPISLLETAINQKFYYISRELIDAASKKGLGFDMVKTLRSFLVTSNKVEKKDESKPKPYCYCPEEKDHFDRILLPKNENFKVDKTLEDFEKAIDTENELIKEFFPIRKPLKIQFSGEKQWISPSEDPDIPIETDLSIVDSNANYFTLQIIATLLPDKDPVTFYNNENLGEDLDTELPLAKVELDDHFKMFYPLTVEKLDCCLERDYQGPGFFASLYHVLRNVKIEDGTIDVQVCGLRNFVVQNDESVMDVNGPVYAFGVRPKINSNFFIGSEEIFMKKWSDIWVDLNWKDYPAEGFKTYYNGYQSEYRTPDGVVYKKLDFVEDDKFLMKAAVLQNGNWFLKEGIKKCGNKPGYDLLFSPDRDLPPCFDNDDALFESSYSHQLYFSRNDFKNLPGTPTDFIKFKGIKRFDVNTRDYFLRLSLKCQDFQHDNYIVVLARQLAAEAKLTGPNPTLVDGAVYYGITNNGDKGTINIKQILQDVVDAKNIAVDVKVKLKKLIKEIIVLINGAGGFNINLSNIVWQALFNSNLPAFPLPPNQDGLNDSTLYKKFLELFKILSDDADLIEKFKSKGVVIPREPWTPTISAISLDYKASASIHYMDLIHLYPFKGTYKHEEIQLTPTLLPTFCDEGTLFLGLEKLVPGENLNILFQLAEATADSESEKENVHWHYLDNNVWKLLRKGFEVLDDGTENLTSSGIVKFALPENMTKTNTIMPKDLHWIKATIPKNSRSVSETTGIFTQAMSVTFTNAEANDKLRLAKPLEAESIAKLETADASVKQVLQPFETFGGQVPEEQQLFYVRVSELLRHKGRAIQKFDYERIVLDAFPEIYKAKCINHSFGLNAHIYKNDFPYAPGYIIMAVIPDLNKLKAGNSFEPKVPVSLLEKIDGWVRKKTSPFVRFHAMNPRYEKIHLCLKVKLIKGKDENYYKEKLKEDLRNFLAPWAVGEYYAFKLTFGQCVNQSSIIAFMESLDYIDYIIEMNMRHEKEDNYPILPVHEVCPKTPRSILIAGDIDVCIDQMDCDQWDDGDCKNTPQRLRDCKPRQQPDVILE